MASTPTSLLLDPERHPLQPPETARTLGRTMVVAPHPDDESLGCGGLLALLAAAGHATKVLLMTDGSRSHHSLSYPAGKLAELREGEFLAALRELGLSKQTAIFLRYPDCGLPQKDNAEAAGRIGKIFVDFAPDTLLVPWRRDPHCDHEATWELLRAAVAALEKKPRWLEYPVWAWMHADSAPAPQTGEAAAWRLDISPVLEQKKRAIAEHRSQMGQIIHDDPRAFVLPPEMLARFAQPWELFLEPHDG